MKIKLIILTALTVIFVLLFKKIELLTLNSGISWTISKILPYFILLVIGVLLFTYILKITFKNKAIKLLVSIIGLLLPFGLGFSLHPIYQGDFSKEGQVLQKNNSPSDFKNDGLMVVTIPDCPYCLESIQKLKLIKKRNPSLQIDFVVCTRNKNYIKNYIKASNGKLNIRLSDNPDSLALTAGYRFPTYIEVKNNKPVYSWSNDQFGAGAIDALEQRQKK